MITNISKHKPIERGLDAQFYAVVFSERVKRGIIQFGERLHNNRETHFKLLHQKINEKQLSK